MFFKKFKTMLPAKRNFLILSFLTFIMAVIALFYWTSKFERKNEWIELIVANREIKSGQILTDEDLNKVFVPSFFENSQIFKDKDDLLGKIVLYGIPKNAIFYESYFFDTIDSNSLALKLNSDKKAFAINEKLLISSTGTKIKDYVDIAIAKEKISFQDDGFIIRNAQIIDISESKNSNRNIILALNDQEISALMYAIANDFLIQLTILPFNKSI